MYKTFMIVFSKNEDRLNNYKRLNEKFNNQINYFEAIDCVNSYQEWKEYALQNNYSTQEYIDKEVEPISRGKLGCNLSHQLLFRQIIEEYDDTKPKWYLILEDDVDIKTKDFDDVNNYLEKLINNIELLSSNTNYVQLCIYDEFFCNQTKTEKVFENTHKKIFQYGTCAYLININAIKYIDYIKPLNLNIDYVYNSFDKEFNSLASFNRFFKSLGTENSTDKRNNRKLGSIIWNSK